MVSTSEYSVLVDFKVKRERKYRLKNMDLSREQKKLGNINMIVILIFVEEFFLRYPKFWEKNWKSRE